MKYIEKIEINYFRSLKKIIIKDINHLNIVSGKNDSGKSNVLKALNLFFNDTECDFENDYNKERLDEVREKTIKGKQIINIAITFCRPDNSKVLPPKFRVLKTWDRTGLIISQTDNLESAFKKYKMPIKKITNARRRLSGFLNKFHFLYVPAVRDDLFFQDILNLLQTALFEAEDRKKKKSASKPILDISENLSLEINRLTKRINSDFKKDSGIETNITLPTNLPELFEAMFINTNQGNFQVPLDSRGQGIKMHYIPSLLHYISSISPKYYIWGFDEPENSCEHSLSSLIAQKFLKDYSKNSQIFLVSHAFSYISLESKLISRYRVTLQNTASNILNLKNDQRNILEKELGFISINEKLNELYESYHNKMTKIESMQEEIEKSKLPMIFFEGESDNKHFTYAYQKLFTNKIESKFKLSIHENTINGSIGDGASLLNKLFFNYISKFGTEKPVIAIFDSDCQGIFEYKALVKDNTYETITLKSGYPHAYRKKTSPNVIVMLLPVPDFRSNYFDYSEPSYSYVSTELLYKDDIIPQDNRRYPSKYDRSVFSFKGNKNSFANRVEDKIKNGKEIDFTGFVLAFSIIDEILNILAST